MDPVNAHNAQSEWSGAYLITNLCCRTSANVVVRHVKPKIAIRLGSVEAEVVPSECVFELSAALAWFYGFAGVVMHVIGPHQATGEGQTKIVGDCELHEDGAARIGAPHFHPVL